MVKPVMVTVTAPQMSTTSWFAIEPPSASHVVRVDDGLDGPRMVTEPCAASVTDLVIATCSPYVPLHTSMVAPDAEPESAAPMVSYFGCVQLLLLPTGALLATQIGGG